MNVPRIIAVAGIFLLGFGADALAESGSLLDRAGLVLAGVACGLLFGGWAVRSAA